MSPPAEALAAPLELAVHDALGHLQARYVLAGARVDVGTRRERGLAIEHAPGKLEAGRGVFAVAGDAAFGVSREVEVSVHRSALRGRPDVGAGLAHALHGGQRDHAARPLDAVRGAAGAAPSAQPAGSQIGLPLSPLAGQGANLARRNAAFLLCPLAGLGRLVVASAQNILRPLLETVRVSGHVFLVVGPFGQPCVSDGKRQRVVGADFGRKPLVADPARGVVVMGIDEHHLHAQFLEPPAANRRFVRGVDAAVGLRIRGPEYNHLGVLQAVFQQVVLLGIAQPPTEAPHVHATPVPAFPAIRVVVGVSEAREVHEPEIGGMAIANIAPHVVGTGGGEDRSGAVGALDPVDFGDHDICRFIPRNALIPRDATVLDISVAVGVKVHALHRIHDALVGIDHGLEALGVDRKGCLAGRREGLASCLDLPRRRIRFI